MSTAKPVYDESSFRVLRGLEPVRSRPGMYTRTDSPCHIILFEEDYYQIKGDRKEIRGFNRLDPEGWGE